MEKKVIQIEGVNVEDLIAQITKTLKEELNKQNLKTEKPKTELMTRFEVADWLGISLMTLHTWSKKGILKSYRIGNKIRYKKAEILDALQDINPKYKEKSHEA